MRIHLPKLLLQLLLTLVASALVCPQAYADKLVVITARENVEELSVDDVARIFLGKVTRYPSGAEVVPLDLDPSDPGFARFARLVLKKSPAQLKAYWSKRVFTGKGKPPRRVATRAALLELVESHPRYLAYLNADDADNGVRWILELNP